MSASGNNRATAVELAHVTLRYESGTQALDDVSLTVRPGERLCVLGSNGSGKSTLASVICGLLAPDEGTVALVGKQVFDSDRERPIDFDAYRQARKGIGLVFQNPDDQIVTTVVEEDVAFGPENLGVDPTEIGCRVERELRRVALTDYAKADPTRLSGGQKQRVAIAGALAMEPRVLVLDEPGSLLDVRGRAAIMRVMHRLHQDGTTIVHVTHFMDEALAADRVIVMDHGRIVLEGAPNEVFLRQQTVSGLGLEEPFVAQLAEKLRTHGMPVPWTCDDEELIYAIASLPHASTRPATDAAPSDVFLSPQTNPPTQTHCAISHVSFSYRHERKALDDVTFSVPRGSTCAVVGQTGSGKSTLLRLICALETPDEGTVTIDGTSTAKKRDRRRLHGAIGYVMQHPERQLFAETVYEDVAYGPTNMGLPSREIRERCSRALKLVGLVGLDDASPFELSGGQQRLCAIAGIIAMNPSIIVLDEPTAGLDPRGRKELRRVLWDIHEQGTTILQVTHSMEDAVRAEQVVVLNQAQVMWCDSPRNVFCPKNERELTSAGLGLPAALVWALRLKRAGMEGLGAPLTLGELVSAILSVCEVS